MVIFRSLLLLLCIFLFVSCGKVAQDISDQSVTSIFKQATFESSSIDLDFFDWDALVSTQNKAMVYANLDGINLSYGSERISWASAQSSYLFDKEVSNNVMVVNNFDNKMNSVSTARYRQGYINVSRVATNNYDLNVIFNKIRPKYDYYVYSQYLDQSQYVIDVKDEIPSESITITQYSHLMSMVFLQHLQQESYLKDNIMDQAFFETIIPKDIVSLNVNLMPTLNGSLNVNDPNFQLKDSFISTIIGVVTLVKDSDQADVIGYIEEQSENIFSDDIKTLLLNSVDLYYLENGVVTQNSFIIDSEEELASENVNE